MKHVLIFSVLILVAVFAAEVYADDFMTQYPSGNLVNDIVFQGDYAWSGTYGSLVRWDKRDGSYIQYTTDDGLVSNNILDLMIGDDGKLWIATTRGVNIFDGQSFEKLTTGNSGLIHNRVHCVTQSEDGVLWIGTAIGISTFDGVSWINYPVNDIVTDHRAGGQVSEIIIDRAGVVWATVWKYSSGIDANVRIYLTSFDGASWTVHNGSDGSLKALSVDAMAIDNNNIIWAATSGDNIAGPVFTFDGTTWTDTGIKAVHDIDVDVNGTVYFARGDINIPRNDDKYITTFDGTSYVDLPIADSINLPVKAFIQIYVDEPGTFWFRTMAGSSSYIMYSYDGEIAKQRSTVGPLSYYTQEMIVDSSNTKWIATTFGLSRYDNVTWENILFDFKPEDAYSGGDPVYNTSKANDIKDIAIDLDGTVWLATGLGMRKIDGAEGKLYNDRNTDGIGQWTVDVDHVVVDSNNVKWFIGRRRLYRYDGETWSSLSLGKLEYRQFSSMEVDHDNVIWLGIRFEDENSEVKSGVVSFDGENWMFYDIDNSPLRGDLTVIAVAEDNTKWIGTSEGYYSFDGSTWTSYEDVKQETYPWHQPYDILIDNDGIVWFMMSGRLHSFDGSVWDDHGKINYGQDPQFVIDLNDEVWIVSRTGGGYIASFSKASIRTDVAEDDEVPAALSISGNYPNPFNPSTTIDFSIGKAGFASLIIYNSMGQKVRTLMAEHMNPGVYNSVWNGRDDSGRAVSSGMYISCLKIGEQVTAKQMMLLK